ncbi:hypothetical protein ACCC92_03000 [Mucilaginibacter sp. Mucisp84]|uniref:hypothetical protein n=1 Tax=Mucilaginibacter sp. Mucisp84 TaxID=3243058 RepID=UPI0039A5A805
MNELDQMRLKALQNNFRNQKNAARGYRNFMKYRNDDEKLKWLLRHHDEEEVVKGKEIRFREDMDFLLGYYTMLMAAVITGYLSPDILREITREAEEVLNNKRVKRYYSKYYPLALPELLYDFLTDESVQVRTLRHIRDEQPIKGETFETVMLLIRSRIEDDDVDLFLSLLDNFHYYDSEVRKYIDIEVIWDRLRQYDNKKNKAMYNSDIFQSALLGFAKYILYLEAYSDVLGELEEKPLSQSAIWHTDGYWLERLQTELGGVLYKGLEIVDSITKNSQPVQYKDEQLFDESNFAAWQSASSYSINKAREDIDFVLRERLNRPVNSLLARNHQ